MTIILTLACAHCHRNLYQQEVTASVGSQVTINVDSVLDYFEEPCCAMTLLQVNARVIETPAIIVDTK